MYTEGTLAGLAATWLWDVPHDEAMEALREAANDSSVATSDQDLVEAARSLVDGR